MTLRIDRIRWWAAAFALAAASLCVDAAEPSEIAGRKSLSNAIELRHYSGAGQSLKIYMEKEIASNLALHVIAVKARGYEGLTVGPAYYITPDMQIGVGVGVSRYATSNEEEKHSRGALSGWWYWETKELQAEVTIERYKRDPDPWYYYGYIETPIVGSFSAGLFGEKDVGWGPRLSWSFGSGNKIWAGVPIRKRDTVSIVVGIEISF